MRHNKKKSAAVPPQPKEKSEAEKHVEELLGPPPDEQQAHKEADEQPETESIPVRIGTASVAEPSTAPLIPEDALPKEIMEDGSAHAPLLDPKDTPAKPEAPVPEPEPAPTVPAAESVPVVSQASASTPPVPQPATVDDVQTSAAVDDIVSKESDDVLDAADDGASETKQPYVPKSAKRSNPLVRALRWWWHNPIARWASILLLLGGVAATAVWPTSRYFVLNTAGVRSSASITVFDASTQQPLKNVQIKLAGETSKTNADGKAALPKVKLGPATLTVERRAFAAQTKRVTVGWGSNPLGDVRLTPTGTQYTFEVTDFLSGKPIEKAEASTDSADAVADENGKIVLTVDKDDDQDLRVAIKAESYRTEELTFNPDDKSVHAVKMAPSRKHAFISKRSGKYDLYSIDVDGKNEKRLVQGTGNERDDMVLVPHPTANFAAFVSTRDNVRNKDGYLLSTVLVVDLASGNSTSLGQSERIQVVDWVNDKLIYMQIAAGASASNPKRNRLFSYDQKSEEKKELASNNDFNDIMAINGTIYYATSGGASAGSAAFEKINPDGSGHQTLLNKETWNIFRTQYDKLSLSVGSDWYEYKLGDVSAGKVSGPPPVLKSRLYRDSPNKQHSLWVDNRDGKGVLVQYNTLADKKDVVLRTQSGLTSPTYWINDKYIVYRIHTEQESADYVMNLEAAEPRKIRDVTNSSGVDAWYYYR